MLLPVRAPWRVSGPLGNFSAARPQGRPICLSSWHFYCSSPRQSQECWNRPQSLREGHQHLPCQYLKQAEVFLGSECLTKLRNMIEFGSESFQGEWLRLREMRSMYSAASEWRDDTESLTGDPWSKEPLWKPPTRRWRRLCIRDPFKEWINCRYCIIALTSINTFYSDFSIIASPIR